MDRQRRYPIRLDRTRIEALQQLLTQNPSNTLARYGLAMEYVKAGELARALPEVEALLASDPAYSAAYFHGGQTLATLGRLEEARDTFRRGVAVTQDPRARSELQAALDVLGG